MIDFMYYNYNILNYKINEAKKKTKKKPNINIKESTAASFSSLFSFSINKSSVLIICAIVFLFECKL